MVNVTDIVSETEAVEEALTRPDSVAESNEVEVIDSAGELVYVPSAVCDADAEEDADGDIAGDSLLDPEEEALRDGLLAVASDDAIGDSVAAEDREIVDEGALVAVGMTRF